MLFLSTPSARRATLSTTYRPGALWISIHALREEGDGLPLGFPLCPGLFLSTPSARRATRALTEKPDTPTDFYPRPPRGGRQKTTNRKSPLNKISIHALREEGDMVSDCNSTFQKYFYPRPPRGGRRFRGFSVVDIMKFLSTPSARRATPGTNFIWTRALFLSTPSARRATMEQSRGER